MDDLAIPVRRFTVDDFYRMGETGLLGAEERVELLDGQIVQMASIGSRHASVVDKLTRFFVRAVDEVAVVRVQNPLRLGPFSEPVPDIVLAHPSNDFYESAHPRADQAFLVVEVSETTVRLDRGVKIPLYAAAGVREVWIVDLMNETLETHLEPRQGLYHKSATFRAGDNIAPEAFPDAVIRVADLLPH